MTNRACLYDRPDVGRSLDVAECRDEATGHSISPVCVLQSLRICFIVGTLGQGGAERQLFYMLKALRAEGAMIHVLCLTQGEFWEEQIRALGVPVIWVGKSPSRLVRLWRIIKELRRLRPLLVQSSHFYANLYAVVAARILGLREIGAIRGDVFSELKAHGSLLGKYCLSGPRWLAANSLVGVQNAIANGANSARCIFLPNAVDTEQFKPSTCREANSTRLLLVGRLGREKRVDLFLDLVAELRRNSSSPVTGLVVGDGPLLPSLREHAAQLGLLPDGVEFRGTVPDLAQIYSEVDILVLTSDWEGTPNVILEASASGLPVVATNVGGTAGVVLDGQTGFLCGSRDRSAMVAALGKLVADKELRRRLGGQGRRFVEERYSSSRLSNFLNDLYVRVIS